MDRSKQAQLRALAFERDKGICFRCGCDCERLKAIYRYCRRRSGSLIERGNNKPWYYPDGVEIYDGLFQKRHQSKWLKELLLKYPWIKNETTLFEAHHVIPLVLGGTNEIENIQTLCIRCHKIQTLQLLKLTHKTSS